jgi:hypothetical protein
MSEHNHASVVPGCYRCELSADEVIPYYSYEHANGAKLVLDPHPISGDLQMAVRMGTVTIRLPMSETFWLRMADAVTRWYATPAGPPDVPQDTITQYHDGVVYGFTAEPESSAG